MKRDTVNYTVVGAVVLVAIALLLFTMLRITGTRTGESSYVARYANVTGLAYGAPVYYEGFRVGHVNGITPERKSGRTQYRIDLAIRGDWPIPDDSIAKLASTGLLADISVAISEGESTTMLKPGAEMKSQGGGDLIAAMNELAGEVTALSRERIRPLVASLQQNVDRIGGELAEATPVLVADAKSLLARLNQASAAMNDVLSPQNRAHVANTLEGLATTADNARELSAELRQTQQKLDALMVEAHAVVSENRPALKDAIADLAQITGALAQRVDGIAQNLDSASRNVNEFTREIRKNPNRLLFTPPADKVKVEEE
ncbi:MAG TPA: MlaD family protein [Patescibacteria group bacterium]|nr:MlaD family protein [Patescibacteria group bacterium]